MEYLRTKTVRPVARLAIVPWSPRVRGLLQAGLSRKLTLIVGVAGSGKTTLMADFAETLAESQVRTCWVSLDKSDNDPDRFWAYFFMALDSLDPGVACLRRHEHHGPWTEPWTYLDAPLNDVAALTFDTYMILDEYHVIDSPTVNAGLAYWIDHMPSNMHVGLSSRAMPSLPLARLRAQDEVVEVTSGDLFFDLEGTMDFLRRVEGHDVSAEDAATLFELTSGWVAGLRLATIAMQREGKAQGLVQDFSRANRLIGEFLIGEVVDQQDASVRDFLLKTSVLKKLTASLCETVTGNPRSREILQTLVEANLFLVPLDEPGMWFRYHAFFSESLMRLLTERDPDSITALYQGASEWSEHGGMIEDAVEYAVLADDGSRVAHLLEHHLPKILQEHRGFRLLGWLRRVSREMCRDNLSFSLLNAWGYFTSARPREARPWLDRAREYLSTAGDGECESRFGGAEDIVNTIEACITSMEGDYERGVALSREALEKLGRDHAWLRATLLHNLAESLERIGDLDASLTTYLEARAVSALSGVDSMDSFSMYEMAWLWTVRGELHLASETLRQAIDAADRSSLPLFPPGLAQIVLGRIHLIRNDTQEAEREIRRGLRLLWDSDQQPADCVVEAQVALAYLHELKGDLIEATHVITQAVQRAQSVATARGLEWEALVCRGQIALTAGDLNVARQAIEDLKRSVPDYDAYYCLRWRLLDASLSRAEGQTQVAMVILSDVLSDAQNAGYKGTLIEAMVIRAVCLQENGETAQAVSQLLRAANVAQQEDYVLPFIRERHAIDILLHKILYEPRRGSAQSQGECDRTAFCKRLLEARRTHWASTIATESSQGVHLSERECEIVELIRQGMSNKDIADMLFVSLNTVKKHVQNIYDKTGIHDRAAVSQVKAWTEGKPR